MMQTKKSTLLSGAALACVLPFSAQADVTALDVWESWKEAIELYGSEVSVGSQETVGKKLIVNDVVMAIEMPEGNGAITAESMIFEELGNGKVAITLPEAIPYSVNAAVDGETIMDLEMVMRQSGLDLVASGDPDAITYTYSADSMSLDFDKFMVEGEAVEPVVEFIMSGVSGETSSEQSESWLFSSTGRVAEMLMNMSFDDPESDNSVVADMKIMDLSYTSQSEIKDGYDMTDPSAMFSGAMTGSASAKMGSSTFNMNATGSDNFSMSGSADSQTLTYALFEGGINYGGTSTGTNYTFSSPDLPFPPVNVSISESEFAFGMPLAETADPVDFQMLLALRGLATDDFIWQMFDPGAVLPRDPATIVIDTTGKARMMGDIFDPEAAAEMDEFPAELHSLDINEIAVSIAGASIDGSGSFTFDNSDLATFDGLPAPTGSVDFQLFGINTLLDNLGQMGLLPQDQAMGARMMLGLFARPGDGEDSLTSTIEVNGDGSIFANGQQLR